MKKEQRGEGEIMEKKVIGQSQRKQGEEASTKREGREEEICKPLCVKEKGGRLVVWTLLLFPWSLQTQDHARSCSHTALPSNMRYIPLLLTQDSQSELEGHDEIGVKVNLKACDEGYQVMGCLVEHRPLSLHQTGTSYYFKWASRRTCCVVYGSQATVVQL